MRGYLTFLVPSALLLAAGCVSNAGTAAQAPGQPPAASASHVLAGTSWRLVEFQSMDDSQGITRPRDAGRYTMDLSADGTATFRLDCNRATGSWAASGSGDGTRGSIAFGSIAATMALCPAPSIGETLARDLNYMRSFVVQDGRLHISLMADGGIYVWEPAGRI